MTKWLSTAAIAFLAACSSSTPRAESRPEPVPSATPTEEFVTVAELWAPDESAVLGVVIAMREAPRGDASDFEMPTGDHDPGDGFGVLFGGFLDGFHGGFSFRGGRGLFLLLATQGHSGHQTQRNHQCLGHL